MCKFVRFLFGMVRWKKFRAFLVRRHMGSCPLCSDAPPGEPGDGWADLIRPPDWIREEDSLWPEIQKRMRAGAAAGLAGGRLLRALPTARRPFAGWPVMIAAGLAAAAAFGVLSWRVIHRGSSAGAGVGSERVEVLSAEVGGRKARSFIFQTKETTYIWYSQMPEEGGRK
jgi:hypothetical protein